MSRTDQHNPHDQSPPEEGTVAAADEPQGAAADTEADIFRSELKRVREEREALEQQLAEAESRFLRARAELDTMRRRMAGELDLARAAGVDSAVMPVLTVYDDLERALAAAAKSGDSGSIVPGVIAVKEGLLRALDSLGISVMGLVGEHFDPERHEALAIVPASEGEEPGAIHEVFEAGFMHGDRLVRAARVTVVAEDALD